MYNLLSMSGAKWIHHPSFVRLRMIQKKKQEEICTYPTISCNRFALTRTRTGGTLVQLQNTIVVRLKPFFLKKDEMLYTQQLTSRAMAFALTSSTLHCAHTSGTRVQTNCRTRHEPRVINSRTPKARHTRRVQRLAKK